MIGIYKITSPTNKVYIGQSLNINKRKKEYMRLSIKDQPKIFNSLKKYGWEAHKFEILEECTLEQLNEQEIYHKQQFINELGWEKALFCNIYDSGGGPKTKETCERISKSHIGMEKPWVSKTLKGKKHTDVQINSRINSIKSKSKPIYQYDLEGNFIKEWQKAKIASNELKISNGYLSSIIDTNKTINEYRFTSIKYDKISPTTKWKNVKLITYQYDLEGNFIKEWPSAKEAAKFINKPSQCITACCRGEVKTAYGYKWKYK